MNKVDKDGHHYVEVKKYGKYEVLGDVINFLVLVFEFKLIYCYS